MGKRYSFLLIVLFFLTVDLARATSYLSIESYRKLNSTERKAYITNIRKITVELEKAKNKRLEYTSLQNIYSLLLSQTYAESAKTCMIGGAEQPIIGGLCSTRNNECEGRASSFKCGSIFNSICVDRMPLSSISERCLSQSQSLVVRIEDYPKYIENADTLISKYCQPDKISVSRDGCTNIKSKLEAFKKYYDQSGPSSVSRLQINQAFSVTNCIKKTSTSDKCVNGSITMKPMAIPCTYKEQINGSKTCSDFYLSVCVDGEFDQFDRAFPRKEFLKYLREHQSEAEINSLQKALNFVSINSLIARINQNNDKENHLSILNTTKDKADSLLKFAIKYNRDHNFCGYEDMQSKFDAQKKMESECTEINRSFKRNTRQLSEMKSLGSSNNESFSGAITDCKNSKSPRIAAVKLTFSASDSTAQDFEASIIPLGLKETSEGKKDFEYLDSTGTYSSVPIVKSATGAFQIESFGKMYNIFIQDTPSCKAVDYYYLPAYSKNPVCDLLTQPSGFLNQQIGKSSPPAKQDSGATSQ